MSILTCRVKMDEFVEHASKAFDYEFDGVSTFKLPHLPQVPREFGIGLIYGSSGSGKSTLLKRFGKEDKHDWHKDKAVISHFVTPEDAVERLSSAGLNSVPSWTRPYHVLSTGEKFRADLARSIRDGAVIDEFTSVVNRSVAKSASVAISKYIRRKGYKNIVFAGCHDDILDWLEPDWSFNSDTEEFSVGRCHRRPPIQLGIYECHWKEWRMFSHHHYLSSEINKCCTCFLLVWDGVKIGFSASMPMPSRIPPLFDGDDRRKYRESRTVILPDYQGMGFGVRFSDAVAQIWIDRGYRFFSKTAHIRMGEYRQGHPLWRATQTNLKSRAKSQKCSKKEAWHHLMLDTKRICYSHEYVGAQYKEYAK